MTDKVTLGSVASFQNDTSAVAQYNANNAALTAALNNTLSRDGTSPNQMSSTLDMNSNRIVNLPSPTSNFDAVRLLDVTSLGTGGTITVNPLPVGGTAGQVLTKNSATNFDAGWSPVISGVNVISGKTLSATNSLTLSGTDGTVMTFPTISDSILGVNSTQTLNNKTINTANGNSIQISNSPITSVTGTGASAVLATNPSIAGLTVTGSFAATNLVPNSSLTQLPAVTFKGNPTNATANATDFTVNSLTTLGSPDAVNDYVVIWDHTAGTLKKANPTAISGAAVAGVSSIAGNTGVFTLGAGVTNSANILLADATYHRGYLSGCTLSGGGTQILTINAGVACSDDASTLMKLPSNFTKAINTAWAVGSATGSLDTGAIANSTWYHVYIIERLDTSVVDVLVSTSATAPTMPTNYTVKRRIGSFKTDGSANILAFTQTGDVFTWTVGLHDIIAQNIGTTATSFVMTVPTGVVVTALFDGFVFKTSAISGANFYPIIVTDQTVAYGSFCSIYDGSTGNGTCAPHQVLTNTNAQIRARGLSAGTTVDAYTTGWIDFRGRFT